MHQVRLRGQAGRAKPGASLKRFWSGCDGLEKRGVILLEEEGGLDVEPPPKGTRGTL